MLRRIRGIMLGSIFDQPIPTLSGFAKMLCEDGKAYFLGKNGDAFYVPMEYAGPLDHKREVMLITKGLYDSVVARRTDGRIFWDSVHGI